jgi:hypothetical protein
MRISVFGTFRDKGGFFIPVVLFGTILEKRPKMLEVDNE